MENWLPEHQQHLLYTLAHVDSVIHRLAEVIDGFLSAEPLRLENQQSREMELVVLGVSSALPEAVPRLAADAFNQMRSALEHCLYAEVENDLGRTLTAAESKAISIPVAKDEASLLKWFTEGQRKNLQMLGESGVLGDRIAKLQAYDDVNHPLWLLAEHTNLAKHRMPAAAALRVGAIVPEAFVPGLRIIGEHEDDRPLQAGEVLVSAPRGTKVPISIWPKIGIRRPHTGAWVVLMHELRVLEEWVRTEAIPILVLGKQSVDPLPPHLDIAASYETHQHAFASARPVAAAERHQVRVLAQALREDLPNVLEQEVDNVSRKAIVDFTAALEDAEALELFNRYSRIRSVRGRSSAQEYLRRRIMASNNATER